MMTLFIYCLIISSPFVFLARRSRREVYAALGLVVLFLFVNGRFVTGMQTVSWDTLFWSTEFQYLREVVQSGHLPGWNPFFNSGEPLYMYHQHYAMWQWFVFFFIDKLIPINPVTLFNLSFLFLFLFYNAGCWLLFRKIFKDARVAAYALAVSLFSIGFIMHFQEFESLHISIYLPYIIYFFIEFIEQRKWAALTLMLALFGIAINAYVPNYLMLTLAVFIASYFLFMDKAYIKLPEFGSKTLVYIGAGLALMVLAAVPVLFIFIKWSAFVSPMRTGLEDYMNQIQSVTGHHNDYKAILNFFTVSSYTGKRAKLFIGIIPLTLAVVGAIKSANRFRWVMLFSAVLLFFISLGRNSFFYVIIHYIPTFGNIRNYVEFEFFVQFFAVCLSGMGFEYILGLKEDKRLQTALICLSILALSASFFGANWLRESKGGLPHIVPMPMYGAFLALSVIAIMLLIQSRTTKACAFFLMAVIFTQASFQWYLGYLNYDSLRWSEDSGELEKMNTLFAKKNEFSWSRSRVMTTEQTLSVAEDYNTFEPAIVGVERAFAEPVDRNLLITKRYYELRGLRSDKFEYFGVDFPKVFLTENFMVLPEKDVIQAMKDGYSDYVDRKTVFFAMEDLPRKAAVDVVGNIVTAYDAGLKTSALGYVSPFIPDASPQAVYGYHASDDARHVDGTGALDESDEFDMRQVLSGPDGSKLGGWRVLNSHAATVMDVDKTWPGRLGMALASEDTFFWDGTFVAPFVYKELSGDFDVETYVGGNADRDNERAGIIVRAPRTAERENWLGLLVGISGGRHLWYAENTMNSKTSHKMKDADGYYLRAIRAKDIFVFYTKLRPEDDWKLRARYQRADFGSTLQVGLAAQANNTSGLYAAQFDYFRLRKAEHNALAAVWENEIEAIDYGPNNVSFSAAAPRDALLVYLQNYDTDWHAFVNGRQTPIRRVNYNFQAVAIPKGNNVVEFRYRSTYIYALVAHLAASVATVIVMGVYLCKKKEEVEK